MERIDSAPQASHIPVLDGVRGAAILMVVMHHFCIVWSRENPIENGVRVALQSGWAGVDLFFALSGFLITGILLDAKGRPEYFRRFYWRRVVRIFPIYYCFLAFVFLITPLIGAIGNLVADVNASWYVVYLQNWKGNHGATDPFLGHTWSLAIEEQFYLIWPLIVRLSSRRVLAAGCLGLALLAPATRIALAASGASAEAIYRLTPCRIDALALGALMAIAYRSPKAREAVVRFAPAVMTAAAAAVTAVAITAGTTLWEARLTHTLGFSFLAALFSVTVLYAASTRGRFHRVFSNAALRSCGKYSYAMYMFHLLPNRIAYAPIQEATAGWPLIAVMAVKAAYMLLMTLAVYGMARVSWALLESRFLKLKDSLFAPAPAARQLRTCAAAGEARA